MDALFGNPERTMTVVILAAATAVATDMIPLPYANLSSPIAIAIMVIAALGAYGSYPAIGLALFLLTAVLFFKRNAMRLFTAKAAAYGDASIPNERHADAIPYGSDRSGPRSYDQFKETDPSNPMLGPIREGFASAEGVVDVPEAYGEDSEGAPIGSYPINAPRPDGVPEYKDFIYRPEPETGFNEFERFGPDIDEKKKVLSY